MTSSAIAIAPATSALLAAAASARPGDGASAGLRQLPLAARLFVAGVTAAAVAALIIGAPRQWPGTTFVVLLLASVFASVFKLRLPLGAGASNLSISYTFDFAALLLLGTELTMIVAAVSAWAQSTFATNRYNPPFRMEFNVAALVLTVFGAGTTFAYFGGEPGMWELTTLTKPLVASALVYYLLNTTLVALAVALTTRQPIWTTWHTNFLWTGPSYFVGASAAAAGAALWHTDQLWLLPLAAAPVYLTFRSYRVYVDRIAAEKRHREEVMRLHANAVAALEAARLSEERYALAASGSNDGLWDWDIPADTLYCSERWTLMIGLSSDVQVSNLDRWMEYVHEGDRASFRAALEAHLRAETSHFEHEYRVIHADADLRWVLCRGIAVRDEAGNPIRMAGSQTDITESRRVQESLARAAREDPLTGLPNRRLFSDLLQRTMALSARSKENDYAVLFIDLDGFKLINDSLGHLAGDRFLVTIAERLQSRLRPNDVLARVGGDEFLILVAGITPLEVRRFADRLQEALAEPFVVEGRELYASASIGIVFGGPHYTSVDDLLRDADTAMYRAKAAGRGRYELFDPAMHASAMARLTLESELRRAFERDELALYYQPIVHLSTAEVCGFEALVRWTRADGSLGLPAEFIEVAEETGLIVPLTYRILDEACRQIARWQHILGRPLYISVNIPSKLFSCPDFSGRVEQVVASSGMMRGTLRLEITENVLLKPSDVVGRNFERLHEISAAIDLDDFGTGYSSLGYLRRYPVDALKLDQSFVSQMGTTGTACPIGNAVIRLAQELGMELTAEGVESQAHAEVLLSLGCPKAQGYLFSKPLPAQEVTRLALTGSPMFGPAHPALTAG